jgi:hypothetical protein
MEQPVDLSRDRSADPRIYMNAAKQSMGTEKYMLDTVQYNHARQMAKDFPNEETDTPIVVVEPWGKKTNDCKCNPCRCGPGCKC